MEYWLKQGLLEHVKKGPAKTVLMEEIIKHFKTVLQ